jgi:alpha-ketoglutarate-dependent taurine dioxygenase
MLRLHPTGGFDNSATDYQHIQVTPLAAAMGAEIGGIDLARVSDDAFEDIQHALFRHKMIYFRDQDISHGDQENFSGRFGPFAEDAYTNGVEGHPNVQPVIREADNDAEMIFGSGWHTDSPFLHEPPAISILRGVEIPAYGGDTIWANTALAYSMLSETYQQMLKPLRVHMSMRETLARAQQGTIDESPLGKLAATRDLAALPDQLLAKVAGAVHPLVRTHPATGEKSLYCDQTYAIGIDGMHEEEARSLLDFLGSYITQSAFTCRLRWAADTFVMWDNRLCIHQAFNDYQGFRREMYRTTIAGETPA